MRAARFIFWLIILAAVAAGVWFALQTEPLIVETATVARGDMVVAVSGEGKAMAKETHIVSAPLSGKMERIEAKAGDAVIAGETALARIREAPPALLDERERKRAEARVKASRASLDLARAERERATAELANARVTRDRLQNLYARGAAPRQQLDEAATRAAALEANLHRADAEIRLREHEIELSLAALAPPPSAAKSGICCITVRAPASGRVLRVLHESEGVVAAGAPLLEIADTEALEAVVELLSTEAVQVRPGADAIIESWGGGAKLKGRVRVVEPFAYTKISALGVEEQRVRVIVDFAGEDPAQSQARAALGHGYRIAAQIAIWRGEDITTAPVSALFREGGDWAAFAVSADGKAQLRAVKVGRINDRQAQILSGLTPGDTIVRYPPGRLKNGDPIIPRR